MKWPSQKSNSVSSQSFSLKEASSSNPPIHLYRAEQVSMPQPRGRQVFGGPITQIMVFRAIQLKPLLSVQLAY